MKVDVFSTRFEATARQMGYIHSLVQKVDTNLEAMLEALWGVHPIVAFSDRPWMRLTKREASKVIEHLLFIQAQRAGRPAREETSLEMSDALDGVNDCPF